jgi:hypothetical protein
MNKFFRGILATLMITFSFTMVSAQKAAVLELFYGAECPHCHTEIKFLPIIKKMYPDLEVRMYEVWHDEVNKALADKRLIDLGTKLEGVPTNIIGEEVIVGFQPEKMIQVLEKTYGKPAISREEAEKTAKLAENPAKKWAFLAILVAIISGATYLFMGKKK